MADAQDEKIEKKLEPSAESKQDNELSDAECEKVAGGGIVIEDKNLLSSEVLPPSLAANLNLRQR